MLLNTHTHTHTHTKTNIHMVVNKWRDLMENKIDRHKIYVKPSVQNFLPQNVKLISYWIP